MDTDSRERADITKPTDALGSFFDTYKQTSYMYSEFALHGIFLGFVWFIKIKTFPSNTTSLLYIIDWLHVSTLWGHHQAFTMNHFVKRLRTFLGSQKCTQPFKKWFIAKACWCPHRVEACSQFSAYILGDPKNVRNLLTEWFIVKAWCWPHTVETFSQPIIYNKLVVFDGNFLFL